MVTLITDHKPLTMILGPQRGLPGTTASRLQRYAVFLVGYSYEVRYCSTTQHANADALSRLSLHYGGGEEVEVDEVAQLFVELVGAVTSECFTYEGVHTEGSHIQKC